MEGSSSEVAMKRICVFCGSNLGAKPGYATAARELGSELAARGIGLVYGGASIGLMGEVARAVLATGGEVIGVIPRSMAIREIAFMALADLRIVGSMHERKAAMADLADGFIALPGGLGTLEEFCEILTWGQLGIHRKPCGLLNIENYYASLLAFLDHGVDEGFIKPPHRALAIVEDNIVTLLNRFETFQVMPARKGLDPENR
ncbi:MAG TPA: TIGR00730 family Rossman fold protein [Candidatus Binataceae bacterium]|nr:TIGR00730 family Rossman fold protein [Candidatus Binataceae bacterium]